MSGQALEAALHDESPLVRIAALRGLEALPPHDTTPSERVSALSSFKLRRAELAAAEVRAADAQLDLDRTIIRSPADGVSWRPANSWRY